MKEDYICCPEQYRNSASQSHIRERCSHPNSQWIYELIKSSYSNIRPYSEEVIYINEPKWMLCRDIHPGKDLRYLIVFKNYDLKTIRNLSTCDVDMLTDVQQKTAHFLQTRHASDFLKFHIFFHYMPSVFQLHAHVSTNPPPPPNNRRHHLKHVLHKLKLDGMHFQNALILSPPMKYSRS